jgi:hypothetical protein
MDGLVRTTKWEFRGSQGCLIAVTGQETAATGAGNVAGNAYHGAFP